MQNAIEGDPNLYTSLNIIPVREWMGQTNGWSGTQNGLLHHKLVQKLSKRIRNGLNYRKGGKNFQIFENFL